MNRSEFLRQTLAAGSVLCAGAALEACALLEDAEMQVGALAELEARGFIETRFNGRKILAVWLDGKPVIFSLICRHKRCTVRYHEEEAQFVCPCHDGLYDRYGQVLDGPPPGPLRRYAAEIRDGELWVLNRFEPEG
ncbi:MAG: Rieske (2Fe-2S) protein [Bacteroidia bacterium]|nr:Rieske (2Fe-2S) protein [Bacteroidia bacterium]